MRQKKQMKMWGLLGLLAAFMGHRTKRILRIGRKVHQTY